MRTDDMSSIQSLFSSMQHLAVIPRPKSSFEDWQRFLDDCDAAGISAVTDKGSFVTVLGFALYRRWRWLAYARENNLSFAGAEAAWNQYSGNLPRRRPIASPRAQDAPRTPVAPDGYAHEGPAFFEAAAPALIEEPPDSEEALIAHAQSLGLLL
jgi:hypothetical protein